MIDHIGSELSRLPEPDAPASLAAVVMARVARAQDERPLTAHVPRGHGLLDRLVLLAALAGVVIASVSWMNLGREGGSVLALLSEMRVPNQAGLPATTPATAGLVLGVLLCLVGLLVSPGSEGRQPRG